jgi:two-component system, NarL family, response regulator LiaR
MPFTSSPRPPVDLAVPPQVGGRAARQLKVSLVNDYEMVVRGLQTMLRPFADRVKIVELEVGGTPERAADVALFDTFAGRRHSLDRAALMVSEGVVDHVVLYTWDAAPPMIDRALEIGVSAVISKALASHDLVDALFRIVNGERIGLEEARRHASDRCTEGLSERELEVLALLGCGLTNRQIADQLYLSVDTIKTYVRRVYGKLGVNNRASAGVRAGTLGLVPRGADLTQQTAPVRSSS